MVLMCGVLAAVLVFGGTPARGGADSAERSDRFPTGRTPDPTHAPPRERPGATAVPSVSVSQEAGALEEVDADGREEALPEEPGEPGESGPGQRTQEPRPAEPDSEPPRQTQPEPSPQDLPEDPPPVSESPEPPPGEDAPWWWPWG